MKITPRGITTPMSVALVVLLVLSFGVLWYVSVQPEPSPEEVFCTADAMLCPDGVTYVGRQGPNCEFVACPNEPLEREITLYYYNPALDQGPGGAQCSSEGLAAVTRTLPGDATIAEVIDLLMRGELTEEETAQGIQTGFPLEGVEFLGAVQEEHVLTLSFEDPEHQTSGGACRAGLLWLQIEATAKAFAGVAEVRANPPELFQP